MNGQNEPIPRDKKEISVQLLHAIAHCFPDGSLNAFSAQLQYIPKELSSKGYKRFPSPTCVLGGPTLYNK